MGPKIASKDLEEYCNRLICSWRNKYGEKLYEQCSQLTGALINDLKPIFKGRLYGEDKVAGHDYNFIYLFLILAKALEDIILLVTLTKDKNWHDDHTKAENIWQVLWDAKERLDVFGSHCLDKDLFDDLYGQLKELEIFFYDCFGKGLYMSPVMLIKKADCNICGKNLKACDHIPGNLYHGKCCKEMVKDFEFLTADIVESPHDMRCRIWPWNFTDDMHFTARIMNLNTLDRFIDE